jgi:microsomal dipeptidase-like Zn-dependent dipeptidase
MGVERVCLGGDFVQRLSRVLPPFAPLPDGLMPAGLEAGSAIDGLAGPEDYPALVEALTARGWSAADIDAVTSANLLGLLRRALP